MIRPAIDQICSLFDIRFFKVSFSIRLSAFQAGGAAETSIILQHVAR